jgi:hypothetical protein
MIKILEVRISKDVELVLGTCVEIMVRLNATTSSTVTIKIEDPCDVTKVNSATMTKISNKIYKYTYQSASTDQEGNYIVTVSASDGTNTSVKQDNFVLYDQETN